MRVEGVSRHDLSLAGIAVSLLVGALVGVLFPVGLAVALGLGSVPAGGALGYALFYRPPPD